MLSNISYINNINSEASRKRNADQVSDDSSSSSSPAQDDSMHNKRSKTQEEKKLDRILANRKSARRSRERRKQLQDNLEKSVFLLTSQNEDLSRQNDQLKQEVRNLMTLLNEKNLRSSPSPAPIAMPATADNAFCQELLLRMAASNAGGGNNLLSADPNNYAAVLATTLQNNMQVADLSLLGGAGAGQRFFGNKNQELFGGRW